MQGGKLGQLYDARFAQIQTFNLIRNASRVHVLQPLAPAVAIAPPYTSM